MALGVLALALLGAVVGSFLNVVIHRLPRGESLASPPSSCPACGARVKPYDNVPLVSWLILKGRCRACGARISARYPLVELITAASFAGIAITRGLDTDLIYQLPFAAMLIAVAGIDLDHHIIPDKILLPVAVFGIIAAAVLRTGDLPELLIAAAGAFLFLLLAALAYPAGMGMGDVKLAGVMGLYLGLSVVPALFIAFLSGSLVGVTMMVREGAGARKKGVPFGPFLALGGLLALLFGPDLIDLYKDTFLN
jgi:leader peptidase (prepilin peptidase) / N-methyltransferase